MTSRYSSDTTVIVATALVCGFLVNRGPRVVSYVFGPATAGVLALLWFMLAATIANRGLHLAPFDLDGFRGHARSTTLAAFVRILAVMTGVEVFANLVAAYVGPPLARSRLAFRSLSIVMGSTALTMVIVGPAIVALTDPNDPDVSVFTQAMDALLPRPVAYLGTTVSVLVLLSAAAASALGIQNLFVGLSLRRYVPAFLGRVDRAGIARQPVRAEVCAAIVCFVALGTSEHTYLAVYAAGVFVLLSMTSWAATVRLVRRRDHDATVGAMTFAAVVAAALFTSGATVVIFVERFTEGVWIYLLLVPALAGAFALVRRVRGDPSAVAARMGRLAARWDAGIRDQLPLEPQPSEPRPAESPDRTTLHAVPGWAPGDRWRVSVPLDGSAFAESALRHAASLRAEHPVDLFLVHVADDVTEPHALDYLAIVARAVEPLFASVDQRVHAGAVAAAIIEHAEQHVVTMVVMGAHGTRGWRAAVLGSVTREVIASGRVTVMAVSS